MFRERAEMLFSAFHDSVTRNPLAHSEMLLALDFYLGSTREVVPLLWHDNMPSSIRNKRTTPSIGANFATVPGGQVQ